MPKSVFHIHNGHYEFLVMSFGLCNTPSTFPNTMNLIFKEFLVKCVLVFFDDILIYNSTWVLHLQQLCWVFATLHQHSLVVKVSKCAFALEKISYLGHIVSSEGISVDLVKISAISSWNRPTFVKQLRGFLGLAWCYRHFVAHYAHIAIPLTTLICKDKFVWSPEAEAAFEKLKTSLTSTLVLSLPNFDVPFVVETDASGHAMGDILTQIKLPITIFARCSLQVCVLHQLIPRN